MLVNRIFGAFTFRKGVYEEVEHDVSFTSTAWIIVVVTAFLSSLGSGTSDNLINRFLGAAVGTIFTVIAFAVATFVISWIGKTLFQADVSFEELVRTLGLAYVWNAIGVIGIVSVISNTLSCLLLPVTLAAALLGLAALVCGCQRGIRPGLGPDNRDGYCRMGRDDGNRFRRKSRSRSPRFGSIGIGWSVCVLRKVNSSLCTRVRYIEQVCEFIYCTRILVRYFNLDYFF